MGRLERGVSILGLALTAEKGLAAEPEKLDSVKIESAGHISSDVTDNRTAVSRPFEVEVDATTGQVKFWDKITSPLLDSQILDAKGKPTGKTYDVPATMILDPVGTDGHFKVMPNTDSSRWLQDKTSAPLLGHEVESGLDKAAFNAELNRVIAFDAVMDCYMAVSGDKSANPAEQAPQHFTVAQQHLIDLLRSSYGGDTAKLIAAAEHYAATQQFTTESASAGQVEPLHLSENESIVKELITMDKIADGQWQVQPATADWQWLAQVSGQRYEQIVSDPMGLSVAIQDIVGGDTIVSELHGQVKADIPVVSFDDMSVNAMQHDINDRAIQLAKQYGETTAFDPHSTN